MTQYLWLNYQLSSKNVYIIIYITILYQWKIWKYCFENRLGYKLQNLTVAAPPSPNPITYFYSMKRIALASSQDLGSLEFFPYALPFSQSLINTYIVFIAMIRLLTSNIFWIYLSKTNTKIWFKNDYWSLYN